MSEFAHLPGNTYLASSEFPGLEASKAFDNAFSNNQYWIGTGGGADWLRVDTGASGAWLIGSYKIAANTIPEPARAPKNWTLEGSNDAAAWTVLDTQVNQTAWTSGQQREFAVTGVSTLYRYFRVNITANNGDATYTQIAELYLYEGVGPAADVRQTQQVLEIAEGLPPTGATRATQGALETVAFPPNEIWQTQLCLEVLFPAYAPPVPASRRNHSFVGVWMGTGHADNASFNF